MEKDYKKEARKYKKHLKDLTDAVVNYLNAHDRIMRTPFVENRGEKSALLGNALEMANDAAMHFGLDLSFEQIKKKKSE